LSVSSDAVISRPAQRALARRGFKPRADYRRRA